MLREMNCLFGKEKIVSWIGLYRGYTYNQWNICDFMWSKNNVTLLYIWLNHIIFNFCVSQNTLKNPVMLSDINKAELQNGVSF